MVAALALENSYHPPSVAHVGFRIVPPGDVVHCAMPPTVALLTETSPVCASILPLFGISWTQLSSACPNGVVIVFADAKPEEPIEATAAIQADTRLRLLRLVSIGVPFSEWSSLPYARCRPTFGPPSATESTGVRMTQRRSRQVRSAIPWSRRRSRKRGSHRRQAR